MKTLVKFKQFVDEINLENGRNYKLSVLEKYKNDEDIKYYLNFLYNPYITTGISDKSLKRFHSDSCIDTYPDNKFNTTFEALNYLKEHNTGDYNTLDLMFSYYMFLYLKDIEPMTIHLEETSTHQLFEKIIGKNLQLGIDSKTINKMIPNLIPEFNVMLANKYFDNPKAIEGKTFVLTTKIDGMRCVMMKENGNVTFWSRQGQQIEGLVDLEKEAKEVFPDNVVFDGELIAKETSKEDTYKNTMKTARTKDAEKHNLKMMVFDYMTLEDFKTQHNEIRYWDRRLFLKKIWGNYYVDHKVMFCGGNTEIWKIRGGYLPSHIYSETFECFELLRDLYFGKDINKIEEILKEQVAKGEEGIMINIIDAPYEFKRTNNLLKVKLFNSCDLRVVGFEAGTNKNANTLGALLLEYKDNIVKCGSGFTDEQRNEIWNNQEKYLNTIVEITYFEETENANGTKSLRFPVFKDFRTDKNEPNY